MLERCGGGGDGVEQSIEVLEPPSSSSSLEWGVRKCKDKQSGQRCANWGAGKQSGKRRGA